MARSGGSWLTDRHEITYIEARAVIEAQNGTMADIDDKTVQTVRFDTVLLGLLLAATNVAGPTVFEPVAFASALVSLTVSVFLGVVTYNESDLFVGPRGAYLEALTHEDTVERWDVDLLVTFAGMISTNSSELRRNSWLLTSTQGALLLGVVMAITSIAI